MPTVSDAAVMTIVSGCITIAGMVIGFLTMYVKLQRAGSKAEEAADKAAVVERKLDENTLTTNSVDVKTTAIAEQTNGALDQTKGLVVAISERVSKLEDQNRERAHRLLDIIHVLNLKIERLLVSQELISKVKLSDQPDKGSKD